MNNSSRTFFFVSLSLGSLALGGFLYFLLRRRDEDTKYITISHAAPTTPINLPKTNEQQLIAYLEDPAEIEKVRELLPRCNIKFEVKTFCCTSFFEILHNKF